jgi:hypothetical protein
MGNVYVSDTPGKAHWSLTQKGLTATCDICEGVGAVLAMAVVSGSDAEGNQDFVADAFECLVPCPGCFAGTERWAVKVDG